MKSTIFLSILLAFTIYSTKQANAQVRVTSEGCLQVDYSSAASTTSLTFGTNPNPAQPRGKWAAEHQDGGLNFWIPWPNAGHSNFKLFLEDETGHIGINDGTPSYHLDVNGDIATYGTLRISSDKRFKTNIKQLGNTIDKVKKLEGVSFDMKKTKKKEYDLEKINDPVKIKTLEAEMAAQEKIKDVNKIGFIAQDLREVFPELVDEDEEGYLNIDYIGLIPVLVEAIKEQQGTIAELQDRIYTIENDCCSNNNLKSGNITPTNLSNKTPFAKLYQNTPNPFTNQTTIRFTIPENANNAQLHVCNMLGTLLKTISIGQRGEGNEIIQASEFKAGMYLYSLVIDGKIVDTKQMILTN